MAPPTPAVAVIFGVGSNIGSALAKGFVNAGYRVATVSRSTPSSADTSSNPVHIQADLSDPSAVTGVLDKVKSAGLDFPSVVIWNAAALTPPPEADNPLSLADADLDRAYNIMIKSPYVAAREAVKVWQGREGKDGRKGTFIMTGNLLPKTIPPIAAYTSLGIGKSGANFWVGTADGVLKEKGIRLMIEIGHGNAAFTAPGVPSAGSLLVALGRTHAVELACRPHCPLHSLMKEVTRFFFADERTKEGGPVGKTPDGDGHAKMYLSLVEGKEDLPHYVSFVEGKYRSFD